MPLFGPSESQTASEKASDAGNASAQTNLLNSTEADSATFDENPEEELLPEVYISTGASLRNSPDDEALTASATEDSANIVKHAAQKHAGKNSGSLNQSVMASHDDDADLINAASSPKLFNPEDHPRSTKGVFVAKDLPAQNGYNISSAATSPFRKSNNLAGVQMPAKDSTKPLSSFFGAFVKNQTRAQKTPTTTTAYVRAADGGIFELKLGLDREIQASLPDGMHVGPAIEEHFKRTKQQAKEPFRQQDSPDVMIDVDSSAQGQVQENVDGRIPYAFHKKTFNKRNFASKMRHLRELKMAKQQPRTAVEIYEAEIESRRMQVEKEARQARIRIAREERERERAVREEEKRLAATEAERAVAREKAAAEEERFIDRQTKMLRDMYRKGLVPKDLRLHPDMLQVQPTSAMRSVYKLADEADRVMGAGDNEDGSADQPGHCVVTRSGRRVHMKADFKDLAEPKYNIDSSTEEEQEGDDKNSRAGDDADLSADIKVDIDAEDDAVEKLAAEHHSDSDISIVGEKNAVERLLLDGNASGSGDEEKRYNRRNSSDSGDNEYLSGSDFATGQTKGSKRKKRGFSKGRARHSDHVLATQVHRLLGTRPSPSIPGVSVCDHRAQAGGSGELRPPLSDANKDKRKLARSMMTCKQRERQRVQCMYCHDELSRHNVLGHIRSHLLTERILPCPHCFVVFQYPKYLELHIQRAHQTKNEFPCKFCRVACASRQHFDQHCAAPEHTAAMAALGDDDTITTVTESGIGDDGINYSKCLEGGGPDEGGGGRKKKPGILQRRGHSESAKRQYTKIYRGGQYVGRMQHTMTQYPKITDGPEFIVLGTEAAESNADDDERNEVAGGGDGGETVKVVALEDKFKDVCVDIKVYREGYCTLCSKFINLRGDSFPVHCRKVHKSMTREDVVRARVSFWQTRQVKVNVPKLWKNEDTLSTTYLEESTVAKDDGKLLAGHGIPADATEPFVVFMRRLYKKTIPADAAARRRMKAGFNPAELPPEMMENWPELYKLLETQYREIQRLKQQQQQPHDDSSTQQESSSFNFDASQLNVQPVKNKRPQRSKKAPVKFSASAGSNKKRGAPRPVASSSSSSDDGDDESSSDISNDIKSEPSLPPPVASPAKKSNRRPAKKPKTTTPASQTVEAGSSSQALFNAVAAAASPTKPPPVRIRAKVPSTPNAKVPTPAIPTTAAAVAQQPAPQYAASNGNLQQQQIAGYANHPVSSVPQYQPSQQQHWQPHTPVTYAYAVPPPQPDQQQVQQMSATQVPGTVVSYDRDEVQRLLADGWRIERTFYKNPTNG